MSNSFFSFKQFTIQQHNCAMKVTTDSCLFGAWCAVSQKNHLNSFTGIPEKEAIQNKVLDIGTGTGLLSLMYVQQNPDCIIDAVELDGAAAIQAEANVAVSPWPASITVIHQNINDFSPGYQYSVIISNPPFYKEHLKSTDAKKNTAHHSSDLSLTELFKQVERLLKPDGVFYLLLPWYRTAEAIETASTFSLWATKKIGVKQTPQHQNFRSMLLFGRQKNLVSEEQEIIIETERGKYSEAFAALLKDYYLRL